MHIHLDGLCTTRWIARKLLVKATLRDIDTRMQPRGQVIRDWRAWRYQLGLKKPRGAELVARRSQRCSKPAICSSRHISCLIYVPWSLLGPPNLPKLLVRRTQAARMESRAYPFTSLFQVPPLAASLAWECFPSSARVPGPGSEASYYAFRSRLEGAT